MRKKAAWVSMAVMMMMAALPVKAEPACKKYPCITENIRCLILDEATHKPLAGKFVLIEKIYASPTDSSYSVEAGLRSESDYSVNVEQLSPREFHFKSDVSELTLRISRNSLTNFENPLNMEPFYIDYRYESDFLNQHDILKAKCLHRLF